MECVNRVNRSISNPVPGVSILKVCDFLFRYLDQDSQQTNENYFRVIPEVKMMQCRKQERGKDCGVYAIAFSVALAMGVNPSRQIFKRDMMRAHLVNWNIWKLILICNSTYTSLSLIEIPTCMPVCICVLALIYMVCAICRYVHV